MGVLVLLTTVVQVEEIRGCPESLLFFFEDTHLIGREAGGFQDTHVSGRRFRTATF